MSLILVEFRRYWSRRMPYVTLAVVAGIIVLGVVIAFFTMNDDGFPATEILDGHLAAVELAKPLGARESEGERGRARERVWLRT